MIATLAMALSTTATATSTGGVDDDDNAADEETDENGCPDSNYNSGGIDVAMTEDTAQLTHCRGRRD
jgi:hypothetical protein